MTYKFVHAHASGRYDAERAEVKERFDFLIKNKNAEIITGTELQYDSSKKIVKEIPGFGQAIKSVTYSDDSYVLWKDSVWKELHTESFKMTNLRFYNTTGRLRTPQYAKIVVLEHRQTKKRLLVTAAHLPSSVEDKQNGGFVKNSRRVPAWLDSVRNWRKQRNKVYKKFKCDAMLVCADWNLDIKKMWVRALIKTMQPGLSQVWDVRHFPKIGTLVNRIIDFSLIRGRIGVVNRPHIIVDDLKSIDHRAYFETFRLL